MVNAVALSALPSGQNSPVTASDIAPSADALRALASLTQGGLSEGEISTLSAAVAQVDQGIQSADLRQAMLGQVQGLGMYFRNSDTTGFPRWPLMTALRAYGLNLSGKTSQGEAAVAAQVQQNLNAVAQQSRGSSLNQALAAATAAVVVGPVVQQQAPKVEAPKAEPVKQAGTPAVDKLV